MKQLTEIMKDVFVVEVPKDAKDIKFDFVDWQLCYTVTQQSEPFIGLMCREVIILPQGKWQILGTITKDEISFDVEPYVEVCEELSYWDSPNDIFYKNYLINEEMPMVGFNRKNNSFRSLLLKHGLFWRNPLDTPEEIDFRYKSLEWHKWQQNEANKLTGKLVVLKKVKQNEK